MAKKLPYILDRKARNVLGFFVAKGLLFSPTIKPNGSVKLSIADAVKVAEEIEPRVMAVLPAALIHFPKTFLDYGKMPPTLRAIVDAILEGKNTGPSFPDIPFAEMKRWAYAKLKDKRTKPLLERRVRKTYRFRPEIAKALEQQAAERGVTETSLIEGLIER